VQHEAQLTNPLFLRAPFLLRKGHSVAASGVLRVSWNLLHSYLVYRAMKIERRAELRALAGIQQGVPGFRICQRTQTASERPGECA
jgi:hypothetical protein